MEADRGSAAEGDVVVDVVIPTYGPAGYLEAACESAVSQRLPGWRLLVGEDGAEGLRPTVQRFLGDRRVEYLPGGERLGAAANHTRLLAAGRARYVAFLHHDDLWLDADVLSRRVAFLDAHPACAFVFSANTQIGPRGEELGRSLPLSFDIAEPADFVPLLLRQNPVGTPSTVLARRAALEAVGPWFADFDFYDLEMWLRLGLQYPVGYLRVWDVAFRVHPEQITFRGRRGEEKIRFFEHVAELLRGSPQPAEARRLLERRRAEAELSAALDAAEAGRTGTALARLAQATRRDASLALDRRVPAVLLALVLGRAGSSLLTRAREISRRRSLLRGLRRPGARGRRGQV